MRGIQQEISLKILPKMICSRVFRALNMAIAAAVRIAIEGQLLLNRVGFALADAHGVREAHDVDDRQPSDYRTLARELECWCEAYAKEWAVTSCPSELHRIQEAVWKAADELRRISK